MALAGTECGPGRAAGDNFAAILKMPSPPGRKLERPSLVCSPWSPTPTFGLRLRVGPALGRSRCAPQRAQAAQAPQAGQAQAGRGGKQGEGFAGRGGRSPRKSAATRADSDGLMQGKYLRRRMYNSTTRGPGLGLVWLSAVSGVPPRPAQSTMKKASAAGLRAAARLGMAARGGAGQAKRSAAPLRA